ncbi:hypothetical protein RQP46_009078 [Phenoliferia psychrophenolica]
MSDSAGAAAASEPGSEPKHDDGDDDARASELPTEEEGAPVAEVTKAPELASPVPSLDESVPVRVYGVLLVGFDHALGPTVEFSHPPELNHNEQLLAEHLPFFALPDGAHARDEDYSYFHLLLPSVAPDTIFGISCNRQISSDQLINKGKDVTRSTVQKAIVVLASKPIFGPLRDKLGVITRAFFAQMDFEDKSILVDLYSSLEIPVEPRVGPGGSSGANEDGEMYMGTSLRELVHKFRFKTLMLLKLLMLQRRTMFYAAHTPIESLCTFQYSLVSLIPSLLTHLEDSASPKLDQRSQHTVKPTSLRTSDKHSLIRYLGLPLNVFGEGSFFQPYLPLQQIDMLKTRSFLVGTSNSIFQQQRDCHIDVIVNIETASLEILNPKLVPFITLTAADRKWMDEIVTTVDNSWNASDPSRPAGMNFVGSDDFIRAKFEEYICSLLACIKFDDFLAKGERGNVLLSGNEVDRNLMASFNDRFVDAFKATPAFTLWDATTDSVIFDLVEPKHPMEGKTNPIEDVGIRLAHGLHDLHLEENLAPTREAISRGLTSGSDSLWKTYSFLRTDLGKRQAEYRERLDTSAPPAVLAHTVLAGVDVAKTGAATIATGIGSSSSPSTPNPPFLLFASPLIRRTIAASLLLLTFYYLATPHEHHELHRHSPRSTPAADRFAEFPRAIYGVNETFVEYLEARWPTGPREPHLWITMADAKVVNGGAAALQTFVAKLNTERSVSSLRPTVLVTLCLDEIASTWPKLSALIEVLQTRDMFFVDSDVAFKYDPYPIMEKRMELFDIVAQDNNNYHHINTGWMWLRKDLRTVAAWTEVLQMDMIAQSRDQVNFNTVLDTANRRLWENPAQWPPRSSFVSPTGLRVGILEHALARSYHFEIDALSVQRHQSLYMHMTCGDDMEVKEYVSKAQGYWGDVDGLYSSPPRLLSTNHLVGSTRDLTKIVQILLAVSHLGAALDLRVVEPDFTAHAIRHLAGATTSLSDVEDANSTAHLPSPRNREIQLINSLLDVAVLDIRQIENFYDLVATLRRHSFSRRQSVRIINFDWPSTLPPWLEWELPHTVRQVKPCAGLERLPSCNEICRWEGSGPQRVEVEEPWPQIDFDSALIYDEAHGEFMLD